MKSTAVSIVIAGLLIAGVIVLVNKKTDSTEINTNNIPKDISADADNVSIVDGKQIIEIKVKGGYQPNKSIAKAGVPTILRFITDGTFDCSASIRIPDLNFSKILPQSGITDIDLDNPQVENLRGSCGMGMYQFNVEFK